MTDRPHAPLLEKDQSGDWFTFCYGCSAAAGHYVIDCKQRTNDKPWPPFLLTEAPHDNTLDANRIERLNALFDPQTNEHTIREDVMTVISDHIMNRPRSLQREIGPSEIGHECPRYIAYKLADTDTLNPASRMVAWRPQVGVFVHGGLEEVFSQHERFVTEQRLKVAEMPTLGDDGTEEVYGSGDLYDAKSASVLDWKIVGPTTLKHVKAVPRGTFKPRGASGKYRVQGQCYGIGYEALGLRVRWIVVAYLPSAGELHEAYFHVEPYDPEVAQPSIQRLTALRNMLRVLPVEDVLTLTPTADAFCQKCPYFRQLDADKLTDGCPGHEGRKIRQSSLTKLVPTANSDNLDTLTFTNADRPVSHLRSVQ